MGYELFLFEALHRIMVFCYRKLEMYNMLTGEHGFRRHAFGIAQNLLCNDSVARSELWQQTKCPLYFSNWLTYLPVLNKNSWAQLNIHHQPFRTHSEAYSFYSIYSMYSRERFGA